METVARDKILRYAFSADELQILNHNEQFIAQRDKVNPLQDFVKLCVSGFTLLSETQSSQPTFGTAR